MSILRGSHVAGFIAVAALACSTSSKPRQSETQRSNESVEAAATKESMPDAMTFRWPMRGVVRVTEASEKKGKKAETAYDLHICPSDKGSLIHYRDFRFVSLGGIPADDPRMREVAEQARNIGRLIPDLRVAADGELLELVGLDETIREVNASIPDEKMRKTMEGMFADPKIRAMIEAKSSEIWSAWVGAWRLFEPRGEATQSFTYELPTPDGTVERGFDIERVAVEGPLLRLRVARTEGNDQLKEMLMQLLQPMLAAAPDPSEAESLFQNARIERTTRWDVLTDPKTMRPSEVETRMKLTLSLPGTPENTRYEHHVYKFDWSSDATATCAP